jgi:hypothetical protein
MMSRFNKGLWALFFFRFSVLLALFLAPCAFADRHTYDDSFHVWPIFMAFGFFILVEALWSVERSADYEAGSSYEKNLLQAESSSNTSEEKQKFDPPIIETTKDALVNPAPSINYNSMRNTVARANIGFDVSPTAPVRVGLFGALLGVGLALTFYAASLLDSRLGGAVVLAAIAGTLLGPFVEVLLLRPMFHSLSVNMIHYARLARMKSLGLKLESFHTKRPSLGEGESPDSRKTERAQQGTIAQ